MYRHTWLFLVALLCLSCSHHTHDDDHGHGATEDNHHAEEAVQVTLWDDMVELFVEYEPLVMGRSTELITHVTYLNGWRPKTEGEVTVRLIPESGETLTVTAAQPARAGIYLPELVFPSAGHWDVAIDVSTPVGTRSHTLKHVQVFETDEAAHAHAHDDGHDHDYNAEHSHDHAKEDHDDHSHVADADHDHGHDEDVDHDHGHDDDHAHDDDHGHDHGEGEAISFLKESQWRLGFASSIVGERRFRESFQAFGLIEPRVGGSVIIHAPMSGRLQFEPIHPGDTVLQGQKLGSLVPRLDQSQDLATLQLRKQQANLANEFAQKELARHLILFEKEAIPEARYREAELAANQARADLVTAKARLQQFEEVQRNAGKSQGAVDLYAPISGSVVVSKITPGALIDEGEMILEIVDLSTVHLEVRIPEADAHRIKQPVGAWFRLEGVQSKGWFGRDHSIVETQTQGRLLAQIDPVRRTLPLVFDLPNPDGKLRVGQTLTVSVLTGPESRGLGIPRSALIEEPGGTVAYVQTGGESFERRLLRLGIHDGEYVQVLEGLHAGERVVTEGALLVRLASAGEAVGADAHGHAH